jgi:hypothetical protein
MSFNFGIFFLSGFGKSGAIAATVIGVVFAAGTSALLAKLGPGPSEK